jgi:Photosynthesis system II assembly factor YCF48
VRQNGWVQAGSGPLEAEMQDVPKIVASRIRAAVPLVNHPDADALTAVSEQSLPERERVIVLEHLALCRDCREIVALALPATETTQAIVRPASTRWLSWPVLRWGFVAVGIFAIASLGVMQYRNHSGHSPMVKFAPPEASVKEARNEVPPPSAAPESATDQEKAKIPAAPVAGSAPADNAKSTPNASGEFDRLEAFGKLQAAQSLDKKAATGKAFAGPSQLPHGPRVQYQNALNQNALNNQANSNSVQSNNSRGQASSAAPFPKEPPNAWMSADAAAPATQTVEVQAQNAQVGVQGRNPQALQLETKSLPLEPTEGGQGHTVERAKDAAVVLGGPTKVPMPTAPAPSVFTGTLSPPNASWTIASGGLQRSLDQGKTWQNVDVNAPPAAAVNYALAAARASTAEAKRDKDLKQEAVPPVFRAVAANGPDVWAGGSSGLLYHSIDSGAHWTRIAPSSGGSVLGGDVVSLDFPDAQHGKVTTSTSEVWVTSDSGQTWQRQ